MIEVRRYRDNDKIAWNEFLVSSKNSTFLFDRNFMEYHKERFNDYSVIVEENSKIVALLPANQSSDTEIISHGGLTYGGLIFDKEVKIKEVLLYTGELLKYLQSNNITVLNYKAFPRFYNNLPSDEIDYVLFLTEAKLYRRDTAFAIDLNNKVDLQTRRKRSIKKAQKDSIIVKEENSFGSYWNKILTPNLQERFGRNPVHSLQEITSLASNFPANIRQFNAYKDTKIMAGATIFETNQVAHAQYISASDEGRQNGAIDLLFHHLIENEFRHKKYFDFGIANENEGQNLNHGLVDWKEGFGGRTFSHDFYKIDTSKHHKLFKVIQDD